MKALDKAVEIISASMLKYIKEYEEDWNAFGDIKNMQDYLNCVCGGMSSKEFKEEEVYYLITKYNNDNYRLGNVDNNIQMWDDGTIEEKDGTTYSYRYLMNLVRKRVFSNPEEPED